MNEILTRLDEIGAETEESLERFMNDEEMYLKYVCSFPEEESMGELVSAVEKGDYLQAERSVHALKGIVNNLGFIPLADAAVDMLEELRDNHLPEALEAYQEVQKEYDNFCRVIKKWRKDR